MRPSEMLRNRLDEALRPYELKTGCPLDWPEGGQRSLDCCRWYVPIRGLDRPTNIRTMASWDTITACLRNGFNLEMDAYKAEAHIMVHAKPRNPKGKPR